MFALPVLHTLQCNPNKSKRVGVVFQATYVCSPIPGKQMNDEKIAADYKVCQMDILDLETNLVISVQTF